MIEVRVEYYNKLMGTNFKISYHTGYGYDMFEKDPDSGAERRNYVGFDVSKTASEAYEYVNGLIACAKAIKYGYLRLQ
jgi:hypothetical protein